MLNGAFGEQLGLSFRVRNPRTLISLTPSGLPIAVTEIRFDRRLDAPTYPVASEDAYLIGLQLCDVSSHEMWLSGEHVSCGRWGLGTTIFYDLTQRPVLYFDEPFHQLTFYVSRRALAEVCDDFDPLESELRIASGQPVDDETIRHMGQTLRAFIDQGKRTRVVDHLLFALCGHVAERYGSHKAKKILRMEKGLAPWQQRRARELLRESMTEGVRLQAVADACRMSTSAFVRGFKRSMGVTPHQWLLLQRVERATELMESRALSLVDVAMSCGFADQSHFTRVFTRKMGLTPGVYQRAARSKAA